MIGVIANAADHDVVREFFELFKTPWEFYQANSRYDVIVCDDGGGCDARARLIVNYSSGRTARRENLARSTFPRTTESTLLSYRGNRIPVYGEVTMFDHEGGCFLAEERTNECAAYLETCGGASLARIGYDLFAEARSLLTTGQPKSNASIPTLDLHISVLRNLMIEAGISFVEIPPVPEGFQFVACLTHDVDHPSLRLYGLDHTIVGFLFRAFAGCWIDAFRGRMSFSDAARSLWAAFTLPFVYLNLAKDFWGDFDESYLAIEQGLPSTFFVIARKGHSGKGVDARAAALRASKYEAREIASTIHHLQAAGCEIGLHGIDAWMDASSGQVELNEIRWLTGDSGAGVRMHWLYFDENSPATLEKAGATYDSTSGYNETVGYRAGTTQAFKPLGAESLLEIPLHAMDTALFYLSYLGLSPDEAAERLKQLVKNVAENGGCMTVNWHDRSLAPERLWVRNYRELIEDLKSHGAWFATMGEAAAWFRKRRAVCFEADPAQSGGFGAKQANGKEASFTPGLRLRVHNAKNGDNKRPAQLWEDSRVGEHTDSRVPASDTR